MKPGEETYREIQRLTRGLAVDTGRRPNVEEQLTRHALESFLDRLARTDYADAFVLKGGVLLAAYGIRRPTKDVDAEAIHTSLTVEHLITVIRDVSAVVVDDGVGFDPTTARGEPIRDTAEYPGLRMRVNAAIHTWRRMIVWDVSTDDPIVPKPRTVRVPRLLGPDLRLLGYAPETVVAEKAVTILERGITSTRWRDFVDIVLVSERCRLDPAAMVEAVRAVANARGVALRPIGEVVDGYGEVGQTRWRAWIRKAGLNGIVHDDLDQQMRAVAAAVDPFFETAAARH